MKVSKGKSIPGFSKAVKPTPMIAEPSSTALSSKSTASVMNTKDTGQMDAPFLVHTSVMKKS